MDGVSAGASTVESSSVATLGHTVAELFITTPHLCTETIEDSLPRVADSERAVSRAAGMGRPQVADMRAHLGATRGRRAASRAAIAVQPLAGVMPVIEATQAAGDSPAANAVSLDASRALARVVSAAAAAVSRADTLRVEARAVRAVATLAADTPAAADTAAGATVAVDTAAVDTAAGARPPYTRQRSG